MNNNGGAGCNPCSTARLRSAFFDDEPNTAGSDPTLISTAAVREGDEYVINGRELVPLPMDRWPTSYTLMALTNQTCSAQALSPSIRVNPSRHPDRARRRHHGGSRVRVRRNSETMLKVIYHDIQIYRKTYSDGEETDFCSPSNASDQAISPLHALAGWNRTTPLTCCVNMPSRYAHGSGG